MCNLRDRGRKDRNEGSSSRGVCLCLRGCVWVCDLKDWGRKDRGERSSSRGVCVCLYVRGCVWVRDLKNRGRKDCDKKSSMHVCVFYVCVVVCGCAILNNGLAMIVTKEALVGVCVCLCVRDCVWACDLKNRGRKDCDEGSPSWCACMCVVCV